MKYFFLQDNVAAAFTRKQRVLYCLMAGFFVSYFLPGMPVVNNISIATLCIHCFIYNTWTEKKHLLRNRPAIMIIIAFSLYHIISALVSDNKEEGFHAIQLRSPLLLLPVALGLIYITSPLKKRILNLYALLITLASLICFVYAVWQYSQTGNAGLLYNDSLTLAIGKQSSYVALMVNIAIGSYVYLLVNESAIKRAWIIAAISWLLIFQFLLASRLEITFLVISALAFAINYYFIRHHRKTQGLLLLSGLLIVAIILVNLFPKTINRFREMEYPQYQFGSEATESHYNGQLTPEQWNGINIRLAIWQCGWELAQQHMIVGVAVGDKQDELNAIYKKKGFGFALKTERNMHNNYLDLLAGMGIIGLILFVAGYFLLPGWTAYKNRDWYSVWVLAACMAALITETYTDRSIGIIYIAAIVSLIVSFQSPPPGTVPVKSV